MTVARYNISVHYSCLKEAIKKLERYKKMADRKLFLSDEIMQDAICKAMEETLEIMLTIGNMIIAQSGLKKPDTNDDIFDILVKDKVYPRSFAEELWGAGGFRNVLAHNYVDLDLNLVYDNLEKGIPAFKRYAQYIAKYLRKNKG